MKKQYLVYGMTCGHCQQKIEEALRCIQGVKNVKVSLKQKKVTIWYDEQMVEARQLEQAMAALDYEVIEYVEGDQQESKTSGVVSIVIGLLVILLIGRFIPDLSMILTQGKQLSLFVLFVIGITTSFHCISMCGGIALSQVVAEQHNMKRHIMYNLGRVISYTLLGGIVGFLGAGITLGNRMYGVVPVILGILMIVMGLGNAGILNRNTLPFLQRLNKPIARFKGKLSTGQGPFVLGLVNGLMPCGPLQLMQIYALSTGSFVAGAMAMFAFSLGTVPLMLGMGAFIHKLSAKSRMAIYKVGGYLVVFLGLSMMTNGLATLGINLAWPMNNTSVSRGNASGSWQRSDVSEGGIRMEDGYQVIEVDVTPRGYQDLVMQKGIPVKLIFNAEPGVLNGCNYALQILEYDILTTLQDGQTVITFDPVEEGRFVYSCWMGMIRHTITVVDGPVEDYKQYGVPNQQVDDGYGFGSGWRCH
ncbi:MAG: sulfite exporter TauE/SafE family protein [Cellulosilyticaceae bacterium]